MRRRISIQRHHLEPMSRQRALDVLRGAGIQDVEQHALGFLDVPTVLNKVPVIIVG